MDLGMELSASQILSQQQKINMHRQQNFNFANAEPRRE